MGPYCDICEERCFAFVPRTGVPAAVLARFGDIVLLRTCREAQAEQRRRYGHSYDDLAAYNPLPKGKCP